MILCIIRNYQGGGDQQHKWVDECISINGGHAFVKRNSILTVSRSFRVQVWKSWKKK